jgi:ADP-ribose pyrophosphatase YjhB (NUDIX family)
VDYKPSDVFVGVIDFFAVLLPGAIIVALAAPHLPPFVLGPDGIVPNPTGSERWVAFIVAAYAAGHILFFVGSALDSTLYDPLRRWAIRPEKDLAFMEASKIKDSFLPAFNDKVVNVFQWSKARLRLTAPEALMEVERFEADSKFFRGLLVALYVLLLLFIVGDSQGASCLAGETVGCVRVAALPFALALPVVLLTEGLDRRRFEKLHADTPNPPSRKLEERSFLRLLLILSVSVGLLVTATRNWRVVVLFILLHVCLWRYAERRWKTTKTAYQYIVVLHQEDSRKKSRAGNGQSPRDVVEEAGAIAFRNRDGRSEVLLVRAKDDQSQWLFPKGHIEPNETPEITAVRELREESGAWGYPVAPVGTTGFEFAGRKHRTVYYVVEVRKTGKALEDRANKWFPLDEVESALTFPETRAVFLAALPLISPPPSS